MQKQVQQLQTIAGISKAVSQTAQKLWLAVLAASGCLEDAFLE